jgi:hypothetical protein
MTPSPNGTWARSTELRESERERAVANERADRAEKASAVATNSSREDLCMRHGAHNPEGDCLVCDKEQADARAEAFQKELVDLRLEVVRYLNGLHPNKSLAEKRLLESAMPDENRETADAS